jgi:hypothetical protein
VFTADNLAGSDAYAPGGDVERPTHGEWGGSWSRGVVWGGGVPRTATKAPTPPRGAHEARRVHIGYLLGADGLLRHTRWSP